MKDLKKRPTWAWAGVAAYLLTTGFCASVWAMRSEEALEKKTGEVADLRQEIGLLETEAAQEDELLLQLERLRNATGRYVTILPPPELATEERLMSLVQEHIAKTDLCVHDWHRKRHGSLLRRQRKSGREGTFTEVEIQLRLQGPHAEHLKLVNLLERDAALIRINTFSLQPVSARLDTGEHPELLMSLNLSTFRYTPGH